MTLIWEAFVEYPSLGICRQPERYGRHAKQWSDGREKALAAIRERIADKTAEPPGHRMWMRGPSRDRSLLVEIFLHEGDSEAAWREAETGGCSEGLWLELAKGREKTHPEDSVFRPLLAKVRATHKRKRNLMKVFDRKGWRACRSVRARAREFD